MSLITFLLGMILFLPNYAVALEDVLTIDKKFEPLRILSNIDRSRKVKKFQVRSGLLLCVLGILLYLLIDQGRDLLIKDWVKIGFGFLLIWNMFIIGYLEERHRLKNSERTKININILFSSDIISWRYSLMKSSKDIAFTLAFILFLYGIKNIL